MTPYSMDLRERVLADCDAGMTAPAVAAKYRDSASWVRRLKQRRRDVRQKRDQWAADRPALDPARLVVLDETWASRAMTRRYGRSPRGQRLVCAVPHGHWKTTTFVAALRLDGLTAPMVVDGAL